MMMVRFPGALLLAAALAIGPVCAAETKDAGDLTRRLAVGEAAAAPDLESRLGPLFERKDLFGLGEAAVAQEVKRLLGGAAPAPVLWRGLMGGATNARLLALDAAGGAAPGDASGGGCVSYAIVEEAAHSGSKGTTAAVAWYHDFGKKVSEQGGERWHPVGATLLGGNAGGGAAAIAVLEASRPGTEARGVLVFEPSSGGGWTAARRIAAPSGLQDARLIGVGEGGAVLTARRDPPKGRIAGAPSEMFRSLVYFERRSGRFADEPVVSALPDPVSAAELIMEALRREDREAASRLCRSKDVVDSLLYFSPTWKGGGRFVSATDTKLEMIYEEQGRPTLRLELVFVNSGSGLLLASASGKAEQGSKP